MFRGGTVERRVELVETETRGGHIVQVELHRTAGLLRIAHLHVGGQRVNAYIRELQCVALSLRRDFDRWPFTFRIDVSLQVAARIRNPIGERGYLRDYLRVQRFV